MHTIGNRVVRIWFPHWSQWRIGFYIGLAPSIQIHFRIQIDLIFVSMSVAIPREW